jgi:hypothetical protein
MSKSGALLAAAGPPRPLSLLLAADKSVITLFQAGRYTSKGSNITVLSLSVHIIGG